MKIDFIDEEDFTVRMESDLDITERQNIFDLLKVVCHQVKNYYRYEVKGNYDVTIYKNQDFYILEFEKQDDYDRIDFNITLYLNSVLLYEFEDIEYIKGSKIFYLGKYYVELENVIDRFDYPEFGNVIYGDTVDQILDSGLLISIS